MNFLKFKPLYQERVWGGDGLARKLGRELPSGGPVGESWEIVDRPEACSVVVGGELDGWTLRDALARRTADIMGPGWSPERPFPILVKWLDCQERLSLQVHPPAAIAPELGGEPKTENWYVADCDDTGGLLAGLKAGVTREQFESTLRAGDLEPLIQRLPVEVGTSVFIPSGRIHAIDAGNLILEIQQNSDTTYRVYDWGRVGLDGKPRTLHIEQSLRSIDFDDFEPTAITPQPGDQLLADSPIFRLEKHVLRPGGKPLVFAPGVEPRLLGLVSGSLRETRHGGQVTRGDNLLLPYAGDLAFEAETEAVVLITSGFTGTA